MKKIFLFIFYFLGIISVLSQNLVEKDSVLTDSLQTIVNPIVKKDINNLIDDKSIQEYDKKWLEELFFNNDFDSIYNGLHSDNEQDINFDELSTELLKERLEQLNQKTPFEIEYNPILEKYIKNYLKNRRKSFLKMMDLGQYYFPMFEQKLISKNIPLEIKYLPIVESAFNPKLTSRAGAKGLWQIMYQTGKLQGLEVNNYVDERSDPLRSTKAAVDYLEKLYIIFGDWNLVLAAYNSGPGNVTKAIRRANGKRNYWNLRPFLPRETANYVPAFFATLYIFEYAKEHGFYPEKRENIFFHTDTIQVKKSIPFREIVKILGVGEKEIEFFNPSYKLNVVPYSKDRKYALRLPVELIGKFVANEEFIYKHLDSLASKREKPLPELVKQDATRSIHKVKQGETLSHIAAMYKVSVANLKKWNGLKTSNLKIGQKLVVR